MAKNENVVLIPLRLKNHGLEIPDVAVALRRFSSITVEPGLQTEHLYPEGTWSDRQAKVRDFHHFAKTTLVLEIRQGSHDKLWGSIDGPTPDSFVIFGKGEPGGCIPTSS